MQNNVELSLLLDYYGDFLTGRQRELMELCVQEDLSLAEVAELAGISRQGVRDAVTRGGDEMRSMEKRLHLISRSKKLSEGLNSLLNSVMNTEIEATEKARLLNEISAMLALVED